MRYIVCCTLLKDEENEIKLVDKIVKNDMRKRNLLYYTHSPMPMPEYLLLAGNCETIKAGKLEPKSATDINMQPCPSTAPHTVRVEICD